MSEIIDILNEAVSRLNLEGGYRVRIEMKRTYDLDYGDTYDAGARVVMRRDVGNTVYETDVILNLEDARNCNFKFFRGHVDALLDNMIKELRRASNGMDNG